VLGGAKVKKAALALAVLLVIFISSVVEAEFDNFVAANPYPYTNCNSSFVTVSVVSPESKTYDTNTILLNITAGAYPGVWFLEYRLDGAEYMEIALGHPLAHILTESILIEQLPKGPHTIEVKASAMANDEDGLVIAYSKVYFTITKNLEPTSEPTPTLPNFGPTSPPSQETALTQEQLVALGLAATVALLAVGLGLPVYLVKRK